MNCKTFIVQSVIVLLLLQVEWSSGARILGFFGTLSRSHFIVEEPVMRELARRGHDVTVVSSFKSSFPEPMANYRFIEISDFQDDPIISSFTSEAVQSSDKSSSLRKMFGFFNSMVGYSMKMMRHPKFLPLKNENFDLLVVGWFLNEYALGLSAHFHCPSVVISPNVNFYPIRKFSGNPSSMSTIPSVIIGVSPKMEFLDRVLNFFAYIVEAVMFEFTFHFYTMPYYNEEFPSDEYPPYNEVVKNVSLVMVTQHFSGQVSEPLLPNVIEIEGIHIKKEPSPLPEDIKAFLDSATDGAIFFSLGSNVKSSELPKERIAIFLNKFRKIKQKVLWKFESDLPNLPDNVKIGKWLPQNDILAHPNVKLFISHCGKGGITESKYHGVPILAIPVFADQFSNANNILQEGWAVQLPLGDITAKSFSDIVDEALNNRTYAQVAKKLSTLYRDRPEHPLDRAAFWIEYVIRHNGAKHMQSPAIHLNFLQFHSVDVIAFIFVGLYILIRLIRILFRVFLIKVFELKREKTKRE